MQARIGAVQSLMLSTSRPCPGPAKPQCPAARWRPTPAHRPSNLRTPTVAAAATKQLSAEAVAAAADQESWQQSRALLEQRLGLSAEDSDLILADAFGWGSQSYWRQQKVQEPPNQEQVQQVLDFLAELGIAEADLSKLVKSFPQVLGCEMDLLRDNVGTLQTKWFLKGRVLASTVLRKPQVLGSNVDCEGSCVAECNRCWARF